MKPVTGVIRMHLRDKWSWVFIPWIIMGSSFIVNLMISSFAVIEGGMFSGGLASIFVYMFVMGIMILPETFTFALGLSVRRRDFFIGTSFTIVLMSILIAVSLVILTLLEKATGGWGSELHFFRVPYFSDGNMAPTLWYFFVVMLFNLYSGLCISSVHRRFGKMGMYVFSLVLFLLVSILIFMCGYFGWWGEIWDWIGTNSPAQYSIWIGIATVLFAGLTFQLLRKSTV